MTTLCYVDVESTGLDPRIHQPYEVAWWREDEDDAHGMWLPHSLEYADPNALAIGNYWERMGGPWPGRNGGQHEKDRLIHVLQGVTLVGSNPAFDAAMLTRFIGAPVWHYRTINVADVAMTVFDWHRPRGLAAIVEHLQVRGHRIPEPDHTAGGDVRATRAVYVALRAERAALHPVDS